MIAIFFLVLLLSIAALNHPPVQTKVVQKVSGIVADKIGFPVNIGYVNLKWFDILLLDKVEVIDFKGNQMIYIHQLSVDFNVSALLNDSDINLDQVTIEGANVNLIRNTEDGDLNMNLFIKNLRSLASSRSPSANKKTPVFSIDDIFLKNLYFSLNDPQEDSIGNSFDYYHFEVFNINAEIKDLKVIADTFEIDVQKMTGYNKVNDLMVHNLKTFFRVSESSMEFTQLDLAVGNSLIKDSIIFLYNEIADLNHFNDSVQIVANLDNTKIHSKDLALFAPVLKPYDDNYVISGLFDGKIGKFTMRDFKLNFGINSSLEGIVSFDGLPNFEESFIEARLNNSSIHTFDIR
ncbi:MAG: translocation/assembly module TamB, partial [Bacteroidota bacterium]|nr:translocation/assembly module TamB [Bacteroidota bacterium]